jgi:hypothetical protein
MTMAIQKELSRWEQLPYVVMFCFSYQITYLRSQLHRAFSMYTTGVRVEAQQFARENVGGTVAVFGTNSQRLTERRWAQILASYGTDIKGKTNAVNDPLSELEFREMYVPSSP